MERSSRPGCGPVMAGDALAAPAAPARRRQTGPATVLPAGNSAYYAGLETGARWLAARTGSEAERHEHLGMANHYSRLRLDAAGAER